MIRCDFVRVSNPNDLKLVPFAWLYLSLCVLSVPLTFSSIHFLSIRFDILMLMLCSVFVCLCLKFCFRIVAHIIHLEVTYNQLNTKHIT